MKLKIIGYYSIFLFVCITAYWILTLASQNYPEGKIEISFHVFSELFMALICFISGIMLLKNKIPGRELNIAGLSMILYSVLNAAGYFGQRDEWIMTGMFMALFLLTSAALTMQILKRL